MLLLKLPGIWFLIVVDIIDCFIEAGLTRHGLINVLIVARFGDRRGRLLAQDVLQQIWILTLSVLSRKLLHFLATGDVDCLALGTHRSLSSGIGRRCRSNTLTAAGFLLEDKRDV